MFKHVTLPVVHPQLPANQAPNQHKRATPRIQASDQGVVHRSHSYIDLHEDPCMQANHPAGCIMHHPQSFPSFLPFCRKAGNDLAQQRAIDFDSSTNDLRIRSRAPRPHGTCGMKVPRHPHFGPRHAGPLSLSPLHRT